MRPQVIHEGRSLGFSSDLSLLAPLRPGLVPTLDSISYATRARRLLQALHGGRARAHEQAYARLLSDAVERVGVIQSVRVAVLEQEQKILLTVSFDGNWQSYIRVLWEKVGALLDVIFCNTQGYPQARLSHYDTWAAWVQKVQVETHFFYGSADGSTHDLLFLRRQQRKRIRGPVTAAAALAATLAPAEQRAVDVLRGRDPAVDEDLWPGHARMTGALLEQGLQGLAGLYRLADLYLPRTDEDGDDCDGDTLLRAAHELLLEFVQAWDNELFKSAMAHPGAKLGERFGRQIRWLLSHRPPERRAPPPTDTLAPEDRADVQGGILQGYEHITHGALVLMGFDDRAAAQGFVRLMIARLSTGAHSHKGNEVPVFRNLALTTEGLRLLAVAASEWDALPEAFRQGMAARAGQLGDVQGNHPDRWCPPVELGAVHAVVQLRARLPLAEGDKPWDATAQGPLADELAALRRMGEGVHVLAVEPMRRQYREQGGIPVIIEHFGYADGNGQPGVGDVSKTGDYPGNNLPFGDLLLGHPGSGDIDLDGVQAPPAPGWLRNSSFLALRRYRQHVDRFDAMLAAEAGRLKIPPEELAAKLMGRDRLGRSLVALDKPADKRNYFTYRSDPDGLACPLHAHVRRANPRRLDRRPGGPQARIIRRSMSFGPAREEAGAEHERGLYFMAYGANLAEQFETVQRWLAGGNSTGAASEPACPILGVPRAGQKRGFGFVTQGGQAVEVEVDGGGRLTEDALPLTELQWGLYLLAPSLSTLRHLAGQALPATLPVPWTLERGRALLQALQQEPADQPHESAAASRQRWKAVLEDADALDRWDSAALWAAVRADHGGALRTRHGILVASHELVMQVLQGPAERVTVDGYARAMRLSLGAIYLGRDDDGPGSRYRAEADPVNAAIADLCKPGNAEVFDFARRVVQDRLELLIRQSKKQAEMSGALHYECTLDLRDLVDELLARLCEAWFGLSTAGGHFRRGPMDWHWQPADAPSYPGHFMAPSRHIFQPWPEPVVEQRGRQHGFALRQTLGKLLAPHVKAGTCPVDPGADPASARPAPLALAILQHSLAQGDADFAARTMAGAIMGFVPTLDGALRTVAQEWQREETLWGLRARHAASGGPALDRDRAMALIAPALFAAMAGRAVPDMVWREAVQAFELRPGLRAQPGEKLVLGLGSASHDAAQLGLPDARVMFGGDRSRSSHPTHACPGYDAAIDVMLGFWSALVDSREAWRPLQGSSALRLEGPMPLPSAAPPPPAALRAPRRKSALPLALPLALGLPLEAPQRVAGPLIMCWGDSWLDYRRGGFGTRIDLTQALQGLAQPYRINRSFADFSDWGHVRLLAAGVQRFIDELRLAMLDPVPPAAILISGGGNDTTMPTLRGLLRQPPQNVRPVFDEAKADTHIQGLMTHYTTVLTALKAAFSSAGNPLRPVPVLLHGYDHPHPGHGLKPWLWPAFDGLCSRDEAALDMAWLIKELNAAMAELAKPSGPFGGFVHHVDLTGTLATAAQGEPVTSLWENELHPNKDGFMLLAAKVDEKLRSLPPATP